MPGKTLSEPNTEYRFTGAFNPAGLDHPLADRRGQSCGVIGYDLNLDRDVPLTFLIRLSGGLETHVLPEEIDDGRGKPGSRPHDANVPVHLRGGYYQRSYKYLRDEVVEIRHLRYRALIFGDRFDGTPNSDHYKGEEAALRIFATTFGIMVPDEATTKEAALSRLKERYPDNASVDDFVRTLESGEEWEGRG